MDRNDFVIFGSGGGGSKSTDEILNVDPRFVGYFINSSLTDIQSLDNFDDMDKNYLCISTHNGAGRDRGIGKHYAGKNGWAILDTIKKFSQKTIFINTSFGGGSGSSIASVILAGIKQMKAEGVVFDKIINLIGILPRLDSSDEILKNTIDTWNELLSYGVINNMIFIDNESQINGEYLSEQEINEQFAELFNAIFDIPEENGRNFDNGNLGKVINSEGCMYVYNLPSGCSNVEQAMKQAEATSILARMYKSKENLIIDPHDGKEKIKCSYIGSSFNDENYQHSELLSRYKYGIGDFSGYNKENNLVLISGCLPPFYAIQVIKAELEDRARARANADKTDLSKFIVDYNSKSTSENKEVAAEKVQVEAEQQKPVNTVKNMMKKKRNIFDIGK